MSGMASQITGKSAVFSQRLVSVISCVFCEYEFWYIFAAVTMVLYATSCYIRLRYNDTRLHDY